MHKKAQGLTLHTIVIAVVVLIVLFVLITVFTGYFGKFTSGFTQTSTRDCSGDFAVRDSCLIGEKQVFGNFDPPIQPEQVCCRLPGTDSEDSGGDSEDSGDSGGLLSNIINANCEKEGGICSIESCPDGFEEFPRGNNYCSESVNIRTPLCCTPVEPEPDSSSDT